MRIDQATAGGATIRKLADPADPLVALRSVVPDCHKCGVRVDRAQVVRDRREVSFRVWCHGAMEEARLPLQVVQGADRIRIGLAFMPSVAIVRHGASA